MSRDHPLFDISRARRHFRGTAARIRSRRCAARPDRRRPLSDQRAFPRPPHPSLSGRRAGRERPPDLCRRSRRCGFPASAGMVGPARRLREAWQRYRIPLAFGEVHHGCSRDEQLRWFDQVWRETEQAARRRRRRPRGHPLGAVRHGRLALAADPPRGPLRRRRLRHPAPRAAADPDRQGRQPPSPGTGRSTIRRSIRQAGGGGRRALYAVVRARPNGATGTRGRPILIAGATGTLGHAFARICRHRGLAHVPDRARRARHRRSGVDRRRASTPTSPGR